MAKVWLKTRLQKLAMKKKNAYVTRVVTLPRLTSSDIIDAAARNSGISRGSLVQALDAVNKEFQNFLLIGHAVEIPHIGNFRFRINATASDEDPEKPAELVYRRKLYFQCNKELWRKCQAVSLESIPQAEEEEEGDDGDGIEP